MLARVRAFFAARNVLEVDTPILSPTAPIATHIDVMHVGVAPGQVGYLHTSPEHAMKRLLAMGSGDIYQLGHVFRAAEMGRKHNPEFMMIEWYRLQLDYDAFIEETLDVIRLFVGELPSERLTYRAALIRFAGCDITASDAELYAAAGKHELLPKDFDPSDRDGLFNLLFSFLVEPHLGQEQLTVICDYPASQAALAKTRLLDGQLVAARYEIYFKGIELANGYDELTDAREQRRRYISDNEERVRRGKDALPLDEAFLEAIEHGFPDCRGVAVGFDRLLMLRTELASISDVLPFTWPN